MSDNMVNLGQLAAEIVSLPIRNSHIWNIWVYILNLH